MSTTRYPIQKYEKYSPSYSDKSFWNKIKRVANKAGINVIYAALLLYYVLKSPSTSLREKTKIIGVLGYFILPLDMIPDFIPLVGYTDDLAALMWALDTVIKNITPEVEDMAKNQLRRLFKDFDEADIQSLFGNKFSNK